MHPGLSNLTEAVDWLTNQSGGGVIEPGVVVGRAAGLVPRAANLYDRALEALRARHDSRRSTFRHSFSTHLFSHQNRHSRESDGNRQEDQNGESLSARRDTIA